MSLTIKEEIFVQRRIEGYSQTEAYRFAYNCENMKDKTVIEKASKLMAKDNVRARYKELMNELKEKAFYTVEKANNDLEWLKLQAKEDIEYRGLKQANANAYLGAVKEQISLNGITMKEAKKEIDNIVSCRDEKYVLAYKCIRRSVPYEGDQHRGKAAEYHVVHFHD